MRAGRASSSVMFLGLMLNACSGGQVVDTEEHPLEEVSTTQHVETVDSVPPELDMSKHSVPLEEIYFDTFDGNAVPLPESSRELRQRLLDAIPPIDNPKYGGIEEGDWLREGDPVLGYVAGDQAYAYPFKILNFHEIVNDTLDGIPVLISYCPLCRSAIVYDRRLEGRELSFGNTSALYESDLVMVDRNTGSYWWQVPGTAIVGPLIGSELTVLPSSVATWEDWKRQHPDTMVLTRDTGYSINYVRDPFATYDDYLDSGQFAFPVGDDARDDRLTPSALVVGIAVGDITAAYAIDDMDGPVNGEVADQPVVIFPNEGGASVYSPLLGGQRLEFEQRGNDLIDTSTRSSWTSGGVAVSGPLKGTALEPIPSRTTFWFAMVGAFPDVILVR